MMSATYIVVSSWEEDSQIQFQSNPYDSSTSDGYGSMARYPVWEMGNGWEEIPKAIGEDGVFYGRQGEREKRERN